MITQRILASDEAWRTHVGDGYRVHVAPDEQEEISFAESVAATLGEKPRWLHCRWLYDAQGSRCYEHITEQPEYYLTRAEDRILQNVAAQLRCLVGEATIVELGSGSSAKTRHILEAWMAAGPTHYVPIDISRAALERACADLAASYPELVIEGLAARYSRGLRIIDGASPLLLLFLGSTIGNFNDDEMDDFLRNVRSALNPGDRFLFGIDLVKEAAVLDAAYNDAAGWTERFILNLVTRMNRELDAGIPSDAVVYEGFFDAARERVEMYLEFVADVEICIDEALAPVRIEAGESVMVEISRKFRIEPMVAKLGEFGFALERAFTDPDDFYAVLLLTRER